MAKVANEAKLKEENLKKLKKSPVIRNFVKERNGCWNHEQWLEFIETKVKPKYDPIDVDQVGLLLEEKKAQFMESSSCCCSN
jgi:uncharacterized alpha/beta hydrolase family protein